MDEELYHLLSNAPLTTKIESAYSVSVDRILKAILALDERTAGLKLIFKDGCDIGLDLFLKPFCHEVLINDRYLDFHESHINSPCGIYKHAISRGQGTETYPCNHSFTELYDLLLHEIEKSGQFDMATESVPLLLDCVRESLQQMPQLVRVSTGENKGKILVKWKDTESDLAYELYRVELKCHITLHRESTCAHRRYDLLTSHGERSCVIG